MTDKVKELKEIASVENLPGFFKIMFPNSEALDAVSVKEFNEIVEVLLKKFGNDGVEALQSHLYDLNFESTAGMRPCGSPPILDPDKLPSLDEAVLIK